MAVYRHGTKLGRSSLHSLLPYFTSVCQPTVQHAADAVTHHAVSTCSVFHINSGHLAGSPGNGPGQHQQYRSKITNKTTTKSQKHHLHIPVGREFQIRKWWTEVRGVHDPVCLHRLANFARIYPRYRDLQWLDVFMPQWDSAIERLIAHDMGMFPANQLARKHPFILNAKIEPSQWAKMAVRGRLPAYKWADVLNDIKKHTGAGDNLTKITATGNIDFDSINKAWRAQNEPKAAAADPAKPDDAGITEEEEEAWMETVSLSAVSSTRKPKDAGRQLQTGSS